MRYQRRRKKRTSSQAAKPGVMPVLAWTARYVIPLAWGLVQIIHDKLTGRI